MKNIHKILLPFSLALMVLVSSCGKDDGPATGDEVTANLGADLSVDIESIVSLDASASVGVIVGYEWMVSDPDGNDVTLDGGTTATPSFLAVKEGDYSVTLTVTTALSESMASGKVSVTSPTYETADQMGRPAINTVFNYFGSADVKNGYNMTLPSEGSSNTEAFTGIFAALQTYIGLDPDTYTNLLGFSNAGISGALAVDVLNSNKNFATTYGPSDLNDIRAFENVLNGRGLSDDVVDVTLILAFGEDLDGINATQMGLISDNVQSNDKTFSSTFPYLAAPH